MGKKTKNHKRKVKKQNGGSSWIPSLSAKQLVDIATSPSLLLPPDWNEMISILMIVPNDRWPSLSFGTRIQSCVQVLKEACKTLYGNECNDRVCRMKERLVYQLPRDEADRLSLPIITKLDRVVLMPIARLTMSDGEANNYLYRFSKDPRQHLFFDPNFSRALVEVHHGSGYTFDDMQEVYLLCSAYLFVPLDLLIKDEKDRRSAMHNRFKEAVTIQFGSETSYPLYQFLYNRIKQQMLTDPNWASVLPFRYKRLIVPTVRFDLSESEECIFLGLNNKLSHAQRLRDSIQQSVNISGVRILLDVRNMTFDAVLV